MMTHKITKIAKLKSYLTLPISALLFFAFVEKVPAKIELKKANISTTPTRKNVLQKTENQNINSEINSFSTYKPVSYTHLDVYKRQETMPVPPS